MTKILIVDDDQNIREVIEGYLSKTLKCDIQQAGSGGEALSKIKENDFDLIILDLTLPGFSGTDILKKMKAENRQLDFLIISGWDSLSVAGKSFDYGAIDYIPKPFSLNVLGSKVKDFLSKKNKYFPKE